MNLKPVIYFAAIAMLVAVVVGYGQYQLEKGRQEEQWEALRVGYQSGYETGFQDGQLQPAKEVENRIHNQGFKAGWKSGSGQPTEEFLPEDYIILVNLSQNDVYEARGLNWTSRYAYQIIVVLKTCVLFKSNFCFI